jgi:putative ABC transport system permease protein
MIRRFFHTAAEILSIAFRAIKSNPLRAGLTMLGIIIGIFTVTLMGAFLEGMDSLFRKTASSMKTEVYYVDKWDWGGGDWRLMRNRPPIRREYLDILKQRMTTASAFGISKTVWGQNAKYKARSVNFINAIGADEGYLEVESLEMENGRFFVASELSAARPVCIIGYEIRQKLFPNRSPIGEIIRVGGYPLEIIGEAKRIGGLFSVFTMDNSVLMPLRTLETAVGQKDESITIAVKAASIARKQDTRDELEFVMRSVRKLKPGAMLNFGINNQDQFNQQIDQISGLLAVVGYIITGLSLLVGGIGIMNIMFVSVKERTREIGIRKAVGANRKFIMRQFLLEASIISVFAGLIAIALAYPVSVIVNTQLLSESDLQITFPIKFAMMGIILSFLTGIISGIAPALKASRLDPVDALRYE